MQSLSLSANIKTKFRRKQVNMSSINWPEVLAIFVGFAAFFIYLMSRFDHFKKEFNDRIELTHRSLDEKIESSKQELKGEIREQDKKMDSLQKDINRIDSKVSNIEGQITQMTRPNVIPIRRYRDEEDEPKEN